VYVLPNIILTLKKECSNPLDLSTIIPEKIMHKTLEEISNILVFEGNRQIKLNNIFKIQRNETGKEDKIQFIGDLSRSRRIGFRMTKGVITIEGNAGLFLGNEMNGGTIIVDGNAGSWTGSMMKNGAIEIKGNADHFLGSSYRGSRDGMIGGSIIVHGNSGDETGCWLKGGIIHIKGSTSQFTGIHMQGGIIMVDQNCGERTGAEMTDGKIIIIGQIKNILPSFHTSDTRSSIRIGENKIQGPFYVFEGDVNEQGRGRIYALKDTNMHLRIFNKYIGVYE
jgi:formylmethanofuran dehydrogenase subunit C